MAEVPVPSGDPGVLLAPVAAAAATGRTRSLARALDAALAGGCAPAHVREALLMLAPFAGFPRTLDSLGAFRDALERADEIVAPRGEAVPDGQRKQAGRAMFERVYGDDAERVLGRLFELDDELPHWVLEDAYGRVLSRPGLPADQRERLAVVLLCALRLRNQLSGHVRGALRCGATPAEVEASLLAAGRLLPVDCVAAARATLARAASASP